ncbi:MAG: DNA alkylation repair protein [archaeon]
MNQILKEIEKDLKAEVDLEYKKGAERYFKEPITVRGVRTPIVRKIAANYFKQVKHLPKKEVFNLCDSLLAVGFGEERQIAFDWAYRLKKSYSKEDFSLFESWVEKHVTNWAACDDFCTHSLGYFLLEFPEFLPKLNQWAKSSNRWFRRASAVSLIPAVRKDKKFLSNAFKISETLLLDDEDLVQKGYGWLLKEASNNFEPEIFNFVLKHRQVMPRTALRYAIEKMPENKRKQAMSK